jgi:hypothetical protein
VLEFLTDSNLETDGGLDSLVDIALNSIPDQVNITQDVLAGAIEQAGLNFTDDATAGGI